MSRDYPLPHPGEILREEFLEPMGISVYAAAKAIGVSRSQLNNICHGQHRITASIAVRLGKYLGVDPAWFMNMQQAYDLDLSANELRQELDAIEPFRPIAA